MPSTLARLLALRLTLASLALLAVFAVGASGSAFALTPAERKATNVKKIDAVSLNDAAFAEIRFGGRMGDLLGTKGLRNGKVKIRFEPASGRATTITASGPSEQPEKRRRGSRGFSAVARDGRTLLVMVQRLPAPATRVVVTTALRRKLDSLGAQVPLANGEAELDREAERTDALLGRAIDALTKAELDAADTSARIQQAERRLERARTRKKARKARQTLRRQRAKLARLGDRQAGAAARLDLLNRWLKTVETAIEGPATRQCDDGTDNDGDALRDFGFDKDPGCVMRTDDDETDVPMPLTCPSPGASASVTGTIDVAAGKTIERYIVSLPPRAPDEPRLPIVDAAVRGASGGPYELQTSTTQLCNYEFDFVYGYTVSNNTLRVTVSVQNNGGYPGGAQLPMLLAAGTSR
jgi:hypothetical protein